MKVHVKQSNLLGFSWFKNKKDYFESIICAYMYNTKGLPADDNQWCMSWNISKIPLGPYDFGGVLTNTNRDVTNGETVQKRNQAQKEMHW